MTKRTWSLDDARHTYSIPYWSDGYFDVDAHGRMCALPKGPGGPVVSLPEVLRQAQSAGFKLPLLVRFSDMLTDRLKRLPSIVMRCMSKMPGTAQAGVPSCSSAAVGKPKCTPCSGWLTFLQVAAPSSL